MILSGLRRLHQHASAGRNANAPACTQLGDPSHHLIRTFSGLDRQDPLSRHDRGLPDIESAACPQISKTEGDVLLIPLGSTDATERSFRHQDLGRYFMRADEAKALFFKHCANAGQQMVVATAIGTNNFRQQLDGQKIRTKRPQGWPDQPANPHDVAAACSPSKARKCPKLPHPKPMMPITPNYCGLGVAGNRKQHKIAPTPYNRFRHRQRQRASSANHRERAVLTHGCGIAHVSSTASLRLTAMVKGRLADRIKSIILPTRGSPEYSSATRSTRPRNSPSPKNRA